MRSTLAVLALLCAGLLHASDETSTALTVVDPSGTPGNTVRLRANITPRVSGGAVTFTDGATVLGTSPVLRGEAVLEILLPDGGLVAPRALYDGGGRYRPSASTLTANGFQLPVHYAAGQPPASPAVGDFNEDGKPDLVVVNMSSITSNVNILLGKGDGTFQPAISYPTGSSGPIAVAVGDFNGDGHADLAVANVFGANISVLLGNGNGSFQSPVTYAAHNQPDFLMVGDFNGDGKQDIAVINDLSYDVNIFLGNGNGTFQPATSLYVALQASSFAIGDFNSDGKLDIAFVDSTGVVKLLAGIGDGSFIQLGNPLASIAQVAAADFNGDGKLDIIAAYGNTSVNLLLGRGDGTFSLSALPLASAAQAGKVVTADFNGDGKMDFCVVYTDGSFLEYLGNGDGTFQPPVAYSGTTGNTSYAGAATGDFNGDGRVDLALTGSASFDLVVRLGAAATQLKFTNPPVDSDAGLGSVVVQVQDAAGKAVDMPNATVFLTSTPAGVNATAPVVNGSATFQNVGFPAAGSYTLTASSSNLTSVTSSSFTVTMHAAKLAWTTSPPAIVQAGAALAPLMVQVQDSSGALVSGSTASVTITSSPANVTATATAVNGIATFSGLTFTLPGTYTLTAVSGGVASATTNAFTVKAYTVSGYVTYNGNGVFNAYVSMGGTQFGGATTDVTGHYQFNNLYSGATITLTPVLGGYSFTPATQTITNLTSDQTANFTATGTGYLVSGSVTTLQGAPIAGVTITVTGSATTSAISDSSGKFSFPSLPSGGSFTFTPSLEGYVFFPPANFIQGLGVNQNVIFTANLVSVSISGQVTAGGAGLGGVAISLLGTQQGGAITDASGNFKISGLPVNGAYSVIPVLANYNFTPPSQTFASVTSSKTATFTGLPVTVNISGQVTASGTPLSGVTMQLTGSQTASLLTDASGNYAFNSLAGGGSFTTTPVLAGFLFTPASQTINVLAGNRTVSFAATPIYSITGQITLDGAGLAGITVNLSGSQTGSAITDASGNYSFNGLPGGGSYAITPTSSLYVFAPSTQSFGTLNSNWTANFAATLATFAISGRVTIGGAALPGVTMTLSGPQTGSTTTDASGNYALTGLTPRGTFIVTPSLAGYYFNPASQSVSNLQGNQTVNFAAASIVNATISGQVTVAGTGRSGVNIVVNGSQTATVTTGPNGSYSVYLGLGGSYTLTATTIGYSFSAPVSIASLTGNQTVNFSGVTNIGLLFYPVTPCRLVDTRVSTFPTGLGPPSLLPRTTRSFSVQSNPDCGIPATAAAFSLNVTAVTHGYLGYLSIWPAGQSMPNVSTLNSYSNAPTAVANAAIVPAGSGGVIDVYATDATDLILDIDGYFAPPSGNGLAFYPVVPCRVVDTRLNSLPTGLGAPSLIAGLTRTFNVPSNTSCGVPGSASAYSLNVTAVPKKTLGLLSIWPTGKALPNVSTLNVYTAGTVVANAAIVPAGGGGSIDTYASDDTDLIIDIDGYFSTPSTTGLQFYSVMPCRVADTRAAAGFTYPFGAPSMSAGNSRSFAVPGSACGIPSGAGAYSLNFTALPQAPLLGIFTTWPSGYTMPGASTMNSYNGSIVANAAIVPAGSNGAISVWVTDAADVLFDINGYFAP